MNTCRLCSSLISGPGEIWDHPLLESPNFVVIPSLGALVEGWVLIVPKKHYVCIGAVPPDLDQEMEELKCVVSSRLLNTYGSVCAFEHGPSREKRTVGCGVDHAHLHLVPIEFDLNDAVTPFLPEGAVGSEATFNDCRCAFQEQRDYLYLDQEPRLPRIIKHETLGSQLFRRAIAGKLGIADQFNWREYPQIENIVRTIRAFGAEAEMESVSLGKSKSENAA